MKIGDYFELWDKLNSPERPPDVRMIVRRRFKLAKVAEERAFYLPKIGRLFTLGAPAQYHVNLFDVFRIKPQDDLAEYKARPPVSHAWYTDRVVYNQQQRGFLQWRIPGLWDEIEATRPKILYHPKHSPWYVRFPRISKTKIDALCDRCERREMIFGEALKWPKPKDGGCYDTDLPSSP